MKRNFLALAALAALAGCTAIDLETERSSAVNEAAARLAFERPQAAIAIDAPLEAADAVRYALAHNQDFRARLADLGLARAAWAQASRPADPVLELVWFPEEAGEDFLEIELAGAALDILATPWRARAARDRYEAARRDAALETLNFIAEVQTAWVEAVAAKQRLDLQTRLTRAAEASLLVAEELIAAGNSPQIDLARERVFAQQSRLALMQAELAAQQAAHRLALKLGGPALTPADLPPRLDHPEAGFDWPEVETILANNLVIDSRRLIAEALAREAGIEDVSSLLLHAELRLIAEREDGHWENGLGFETAPPIFDFGRSRRATARIAAIQAAERHAAARLSAERSAEMLRADWDGALAEADHLRDAQLPAVEALLERSMLHYNAMQLGVFELIQVFQLTGETGQSYVDALERAHIAAISARLLIAGGMPEAAAPGEIRSAGAAPDPGGH